MIECTDGYKSAIIGATRQMYIKAVVDLIDPDITYGSITRQGESVYSKVLQIITKTFDNPPKYATLENDRWKLDGSWKLYPPVGEITDDIGYMSEELSGADGQFSNAQFVEITFNNVSVLQACSVYFPDNDYDGVPEEFTIEVKQGGTAYFTKTVTGNTKASVSFGGFTVNNPDAIRITVTKMSRAYRRLRIVEIVPGIYEQWTNDIICELTVNQQINPACTSLPYGTATLKMDNLSRRFEPRSKNGLFQSIEERQGIPVFIGCRLASGDVEYKQTGIFYQSSGGWKTGDNGLTMQWDLVDIIGLLANRAYIVPSPLPTTLDGWIADLVAQLGINFATRYKVNAAYADMPITALPDNIKGKKCGDILRYVCMAAGCFPFADAATGKLAVEPMWSGGNKITLDNLSKYPVMKANDDLAYVAMKIYNGTTITEYKLSGNSTASSKTVSIDNPFIHTEAAALTAAKNIISQYGGNQIEITGRGDPAGECGDVDSVQLDKSQATSARRLSQQFSFSGGIMSELPSTLLQADGSLLFNTRKVLTGSGTWAAPPGKTSLGIILIGGGNGGTNGTTGSFAESGIAGTDGLGGKVFAATININDGQSFAYSCGAGGAANGGIGGNTTFGANSSASGNRYNGYTDVRSGDVYGRNGVEAPVDGSGDGGKAGAAGSKGVQQTVKIGGTWMEAFAGPGFGVGSYVDLSHVTGDNVSGTFLGGNKILVTTAAPSAGGIGKAGADGSIIIWYEGAS